MQSKTLVQLRERAEQCRRLARTATDKKLIDQLNALAVELDVEAKKHGTDDTAAG